VVQAAAASLPIQASAKQANNGNAIKATQANSTKKGNESIESIVNDKLQDMQEKIGDVSKLDVK